jgi:hypothetical protein
MCEIHHLPLPTGPVKATATAATATSNTTGDNNNNTNQEDEEASPSAKDLTTAKEDTNSSSPTDKLTMKLLVSRAKLLTKALRATEEELLTIQSKVNTLKNTEKNQRKKLVAQIFKTVQRIGFPRSMYPTIMEQLETKEEALSAEELLNQRKSYLLTWEEFLQECNFPSIVKDDLTMTKVEVIRLINEAISTLNHPENQENKEVTMWYFS